jgi:hypothetical protein
LKSRSKPSSAAAIGVPPGCESSVFLKKSCQALKTSHFTLTQLE